MEKKPNETPAALLRRLTRGTVADIDISPVNGLQAAKAQSHSRFLAAIYKGGDAFFFAGAARSEETFRRSSEGMRQLRRSFHAITAAERTLAGPLTLRKAEASTRIAELARSSPLGAQAEGWLRLINALYPEGEPEPGQTLKVVE